MRKIGRKRLFPKQRSQLKLTLWQNKTFNHGCWSLVVQRRIVFILLQIPPPACSAAQPHVHETESRHWTGQKTSNQETTYEVEEAGLFTVCSILISICSLTLLPCVIWTLKKVVIVNITGNSAPDTQRIGLRRRRSGKELCRPSARGGLSLPDLAQHVGTYISRKYAVEGKQL